MYIMQNSIKICATIEKKNMLAPILENRKWPTSKKIRSRFKCKFYLPFTVYLKNGDIIRCQHFMQHGSYKRDYYILTRF